MITQRTRWAFVALAITIGCRDQSAPTHPRLAQTGASKTVVGLNGAWDTFAADVSVQGTRLDRTGKPIIGEHPVVYHLERHVKGAYWDLVLTFASREHAVTSHSDVAVPAGPMEAARFESDGDGSPPRMYDGSGHQLLTPPPSLPASLRAKSPDPATTRALNAARALSAAGAVHPITPASDRSWARAFVLAPEGRADRAASLQRQLGLPQRNGVGLDEYVIQRDSTTITVDADPSLAAIVGMTESVNGSVQRRWAISYTTAADGTATKSEVRVETATTGGGRRVLDTRYTNVHFEKRIGS